jgi:hypothetical protein
MMPKRVILFIFWLVLMVARVSAQTDMPGLKVKQSSTGQPVFEITATDTETIQKQKEFLEEYYESSTLRISKEYRSGIYLIYDCEGRFYACVNSQSFEYCKEKRARSKEKKRKLMACAPLKKFDTGPACIETLYKTIHNPVDKAFCLWQKENTPTPTATPKISNTPTPLSK